MSVWLNIIGVTEKGIEALDPLSRKLIADAKMVLGPKRFIEQLPQNEKHQIWQSPIASMIAQVGSQRGTDTAILATGDPNWFGIGATLARYLDQDEYALHPAASSLQLAAARMRWPLQNIRTISLHGREVENLHPHILPGNRILALTSTATSLADVADMLVQRGYEESPIAILENLGAVEEEITSCKAHAARDCKIGDFFVLAIDCVASDGATLLAQSPGLPDDAFISDGQLTKREVRASTLAKLAPYPGGLLWDVGAGCGSVGIEWMRAAKDAKAICFEHDFNRLQMIADNRANLGVPAMEIVSGKAPDSLEGQAPPVAVFLGGAVADSTVFAACWKALKPGGRLVANAVTVEGEQALYKRHQDFGGELTRIDISVLDRVGDYRALRPRMAVLQWLVIKGSDQ